MQGENRLSGGALFREPYYFQNRNRRTFRTDRLHAAPLATTLQCHNEHHDLTAHSAVVSSVHVLPKTCDRRKPLPSPQVTTLITSSTDFIQCILANCARDPKLPLRDADMSRTSSPAPVTSILPVAGAFSSLSQLAREVRVGVVRGFWAPAACGDAARSYSGHNFGSPPR